MRHTFTTSRLALLGGLMLAQIASAAPNTGTTTPEREAGRCRAEYRLCMDVAEIDYNDCMGWFNDFGKCLGEWGDAVSACLDDLNGCLDKAGVAVNISPWQAVTPDYPQEVAPVAPSEEPSPNQGIVVDRPLFLAPRSLR